MPKIVLTYETNDIADERGPRVASSSDETII